jgi:hypothetical protein
MPYLPRAIIAGIPRAKRHEIIFIKKELFDLFVVFLAGSRKKYYYD